MTASDLMKTDPKLLKPDVPVVALMQLFRDNPNVGFIVMNEDQVVMGVISKDDLFTAGLELHIPTYLQLLNEARFAKDSKKELPYAAQKIMHATAQDVMNQGVFFAHTDTPIEVVAAALSGGRQTIVPVVDQDNKFLGIIENTDVLLSVANGTPAPRIDTADRQRPVDSELKFVRKHMSSRFSYIAESRAHLWLSMTIVLFVIGFVLGIIFIVDPQPIAQSLDNNIRQLLDSIFSR